MKLTVDSREVQQAVAVWNAALERHARTGFHGVASKQARKYIYLDEEVNGPGMYAGRFLIDRESGDIHGIEGYGKARSAVIMNLREWVTYWETTPGRPARIGAYLNQTGRAVGASQARGVRFAVVAGGLS